MTTFSSYGAVPAPRQAELIRALARPSAEPNETIARLREVLDAVELTNGRE